MLLKPTRRIWTLGALVFVLTSGLIYIWTFPLPIAGAINYRPQRQIPLSSASLTPGPSNATLGFGVIYVLAQDSTTWRVQGLLKAANYTGLQIEIPPQTRPSDEDVRAHTGGEPAEGYGHARSLLNHLAILDTFVQSNFETALIMEDDVDFGINIKAQMELVSRALWNRANASASQKDLESNPYRDGDWDIFWPGHFGMAFVKGTEIVKYSDPYALPWSQLSTTFNDYYEQMASQSEPEFPEPQQVVFNVAPLATFAYAVTRTHAARLLHKMRKEGTHKFDDALHVDCKGLAHRCVAPVPQLFHHHKLTGERSLSTKAHQEDGPQDMSWYMNQHKYTFNIEWSARCNAAGLGEKLGDKWQCLPNVHDPIM